jgi:hypothetical protein
MGITIDDNNELYLDKRQCLICGKPTYRLGLESGDRERGEMEPLICNPCLITIRRDMATEFDLRQQVKSLETKVWGLSVGFSVVFGIAGLLVGKFLL